MPYVMLQILRRATSWKSRARMGRGTAIDVHAGGKSGKGGGEKDRPEDRWEQMCVLGPPAVRARLHPCHQPWEAVDICASIDGDSVRKGGEGS